MSYKCAVCGTEVDDLTKFTQHTETHIVDVIKKKHPDWVEKNGLCRKCLDYYRKQIKGNDV